MKEYLKTFQYLDIQTRKNISSLFMGNFKSAFKWNGMFFSDFIPREEGDDATRIDWLVSAREGKILTRRMEEERELSVMFFLDISPSLDFWFGKTKKDILFELLFLIGLSSLDDGDSVWAILCWWEKLELISPTKLQSGIFSMFSKINNYIPTKKCLNITESIRLFQRLKFKKNIIFILTDSTQVDEKLLKSLSFQNEIIWVNIFHSFENTLEVPDASLLSFSSSEWTFMSVDIQNTTKKQQFCEERKKKLDNFAQMIRKSGAEYIILDETQNIFKTFFTFMKQRGSSR